MLSAEEYKEVCALRRQGWSISAIARCLDRDRKTVRAYLKGERSIGVRPVTRDEFLPFIPYCQQRLDDDPHLRANVLYREIVELGYPRAYSTFTRALRRHVTRPRYGPCHRARASPGHGSAEEVQFDWVRLPRPPAGWDCGHEMYLLMGLLTRSGRWRAALTATNDLPHCVEALDRVLRRLGGTGERWLFEGTPPVCSTVGKVTAVFHEVAKYYGAFVAVRPQTGAPGPVIRAHRSAVLHWWDSMAGDLGLNEAQDFLDRLTERSDRWYRQTGHPVRALLPLPSKPFPARICVRRRVGLHGLLSFEGNFYLMPAGFVGTEVEVRWRLDESHLAVTTGAGAVVAAFPRAPRDAGWTVAQHRGPGPLERPHRASGAAAPSRDACRIGRPRSVAAPAADRAVTRFHGERPAHPPGRDGRSKSGSASSPTPGANG